MRKNNMPFLIGNYNLAQQGCKFQVPNDQIPNKSQIPNIND